MKTDKLSAALAVLFLVCCVWTFGLTGTYAEEIRIAPEEGWNEAFARVAAFRKANPNYAQPVVVSFAAGTRLVKETLHVPKNVSGSAVSPTIFQAENGAKVHVSGGIVLSKPVPVTNPEWLRRLPEAARSHVVQFDLKAAGTTDCGDFTLNFEHAIQLRVASTDRQGEFTMGSVPPPKNPTSAGRLQLYYNGKPLEIARSKDVVSIAEILGPSLTNVRGHIACREGVFRYAGDLPAHWKDDPNAFVCGSWSRDWAEQRHKIETIDADKRIMTLRAPFHTYGYAKGQWFFGFNILSELDAPGEWYLDFRSGTLVLWPPENPVSGAAARVEIPVVSRLVEMDHVRHVAFRGFTFELSRNSAVAMTNCEQCVVRSCAIHNCGQHGVTIQDGRECGVEDCELYDLGGGGVWLVDGNRKTLEHSGHFVRNCDIHNFGLWDRMYRPGIVMSGTGMIASHNSIHDAPHAAIIFGGNDHLMEYNEISCVCRESNDCGAIYAGRAWILRGHVLRYNYLHDILGRGGRPCKGIYLDDSFASALVYANVFFRVSLPVFIGGGRENVVDNNLFIDCPNAIFIDERGTNWQKPHIDGRIKEAREHGTQWGVHFREPPYITKYPTLATLLDGDVYRAVGNVVTHNIFWAADGEFIRKVTGGAVTPQWWNRIPARTREIVKMEDNLIDTDPGVVDFANRDFRLRSDSPAFKLGIDPIPFQKIGRLPSK